MNNYRFCNSANSVKFHEQEDELQKIIVLKTRLNPGKNHLPILHLQRRTVNHLLQNNSFDCFEPLRRSNIVSTTELQFEKQARKRPILRTLFSFKGTNSRSKVAQVRLRTRGNHLSPMFRE